MAAGKFTCSARTATPFGLLNPREGTTLFRRSGSVGLSGVGTVSGYDEVCTTPCNVSMPAGTHTFAVAKPGGKPHEADPVVLPAGNATMTVAVVDRTSIRIGLGVLGAAGLIAGLTMVVSNSRDSSGGGSIAGPLLLAGIGGGLFGLAFGIPDGATVAVNASAPVGNAAANRSSAWLKNRPRDATSLRDRLSGITLSARF